MTHKVVLVTGATSGIGAATARRFAHEGYRVIITGRRNDRLKKLKQDLEEEYGVKVHALNFDISDRKKCEAAIEGLPRAFQNIDVLVNNAGRASDFVHFHEGDVKNWEEVIDINVKGILYITKFVSDRMIKRGSGHIVIIGSIAGTEPYEFGNIYSATKHAVHALAQSLRIDLLGYGVRVTEIRPGKVATEFSYVRFHGDKEKADKVYQGFKPLAGDDVAESIFWAISQPPHVNINDIVITPYAQANSYYMRKDGGEYVRS